MKTRFLPVLFGLMSFSALAYDIAIKPTALGQVYTNSKGMTLYYYDKDTADLSHCYGDCAKSWPPFLVQDKTSMIPGLGKTEREDGTQQWTLDHRPLYLWQKDQNPGDITGAGVKNVWSLARADEVPVNVYMTNTGKILTNKNNLSLYTFAKDSKGTSVCYEECATNWPPLVAQKGDKASGPFSVVARKDGTYQWAYQDKPLYSWVKDQKPGDISGDKIKQVWDLVHL